MTMYRPQKLWSTAIRLGTTTYNYYNPQSLGTGKAPPVIITLAMQHVHCVCSKYTCCCCLAFSMCSSTTTTYLLCFLPRTCTNANLCKSEPNCWPCPLGLHPHSTSRTWGSSILTAGASGKIVELWDEVVDLQVRLNTILGQPLVANQQANSKCLEALKRFRLEHHVTLLKHSVASSQ